VISTPERLSKFNVPLVDAVYREAHDRLWQIFQI